MELLGGKEYLFVSAYNINHLNFCTSFWGIMVATCFNVNFSILLVQWGTFPQTFIDNLLLFWSLSVYFSCSFLFWLLCSVIFLIVSKIVTLYLLSMLQVYFQVCIILYKLSSFVFISSETCILLWEPFPILRHRSILSCFITFLWVGFLYICPESRWIFISLIWNDI